MGVQSLFVDVAFRYVGEEVTDHAIPAFVEFYHFLLVALVGPGFCVFDVRFPRVYQHHIIDVIVLDWVGHYVSTWTHPSHADIGVQELESTLVSLHLLAGDDDT